MMLKVLDITAQNLQPTMTHQFMLKSSNKLEADRARQKLSAWSYNGEQVFDINERSDENSIYFGNQISSMVPDGVIIHDHYNDKEIKFKKYFYRINEVKSGCHHPDGVLWFKTGKHANMSHKASILDIFPTIAEIMDTEIPAEIRNFGKSLKDEFL